MIMVLVYYLNQKFHLYNAKERETNRYMKKKIVRREEEI
jgi:hypothetical protein